jgi:hypothetical protein
MNLTRLPTALGCLALSVGAVQAATTFSTPVSLFQGGVAPGPTLAGGTLTVTTAVNSLNNTAAFNVSDPGPWARADFAFSFRIFNPAQVPPANITADGFSFNFVNTGVHGSTGAIDPNRPGFVFAGEEPNVSGLLGFAFDTWNNAEVGGIEGSDLQQIALHYNGAVVTSVNDTRLLPTPFMLDDGTVRNVAGSVNFAAGTVSLAVDGQSIFNNVAVPGLTPHESRILFAGRTGGENELVEVTGLAVNFVPEPGAIALGLLGTALIFRRRRRQ